ncbi:MAG: helix-turn-helix transcriptional regulator [Bacteriovoracaceae bacterium]|jgi:transcriptional regulator with XRE-family HTH domain|nr:helix-turn-helix transcriptional regulator [Bacteriovoracaceae bacterium]
MRYFGHIAKLIKDARLTHPKKYSQTELSTRLGYKNGQFISNIERGLCSVPVKSLSLLTQTLNIEPAKLKVALLADMNETLENYLADDKTVAKNAPNPESASVI